MSIVDYFESARKEVNRKSAERMVKKSGASKAPINRYNYGVSVAPPTPRNYGAPPAPIVKTYPTNTAPQNYGTLPFMMAQPTGIDLINQQTGLPPIKGVAQPIQNREALLPKNYGTLPDVKTTGSTRTWENPVVPEYEPQPLRDLYGYVFGIGKKPIKNKVEFAFKYKDQLAKMAADNAGPEREYSEYTKLTPAERETYNIMLYSQGEAKADEYLKRVMRNVYEREGKRIAEGSDNPIKRFGVTATAGFASGVEGMRDAIKAAKRDATASPTSPFQVAHQINRSKMGGVEGTISDVAHSMANMAPSIMLNTVLPGSGTFAFGLSAGGNAYNQALQEGKAYNEALAYGLMKGTSEAALQKILGGVGALTGKTVAGKLVGDNIDEVIRSIAKSPVGQTVLKKLINMAGEFTEEYLQEILEPVFRNIAFGENNEFKPFTKEALYAGVLGALTSAAMGTVTGEDLNIYRENKTAKALSEIDKAYAGMKTDLFGADATKAREAINKVYNLPRAPKNYGTLPKAEQQVQNYGTVPNAVNLPLKQAVQAETQQDRVNVPQQQETSVKGQETAKNYGQNTVGAAEHNPSSYDALLNTHGAIPPGEKPARNVDVPKKSADGRNVRRLSRTVMEAEIMPNEMVSDLEKEIASGRMSYDVISDKSAEYYANRVIKENGFNGALQFWDNIINGNGRIDKNTFALGQVLLNQAMTNGDTTLAMKLISELGVASTIGGQITQANRMIKKMTPDGRLYHLEVTVKKINQELADKKGDEAPTVKIDENLAKDLLNSQTQEEVEENAERIEQDIADQLDVTLGEKLEHWRYTGMLGNIKTHVRNIIGNASMYVNKQIKDKIGAVMEKALPKSKRTKSFTTNKADRAFAEADFNEFSDAISGEGKYNTKQGIMSKRVIYKTRALEWLRNTNSKFLEMEDVFFLKANYISSFAQAMKARGLTAEFLKSGTPESNQQLAELREYATNEAQRATFRDASALANALSRLEKSGKGGAFLVKGLMPFKKVPINILKRGVGYSPVGIIKGTYDTLVSVRNGTKTATQAIDTLSAGLTGTGIMALGAFLASAGLIVGGKDDDDRYQSFEAMQGSQNYAIKFMGKTYTIDWLAPTSIPLMAGVELFNDLKNSEGFTITKFFDSLSKISEPAFELSTLQGLNNTIKSAMYNPDNPLSSMLARIAQNYVGQFFPTILGQAARTIDENRRSVYVDKNAPIPAFIQETSQRLMSKIPGASFLLSPMVDLWGRELKGEENVALRAFENFISPGYLEGDKATALDREIDRLYKKTGNKSVIPRKADKYFQVDGKRLDLTQGQYYRYAKAKGQMSYEYADKIRKNPAYKKLADVDKAGVIAKAYEYANARAKTQVSDYKLDGWYKKAEKAGIMLDDYLILRQMLPPTPKKAEVSETAHKISPSKKSKLVNLYYGK